MDKTEMLRKEETLDPADWSALDELAHRMLQDMLDHLKTIGKRPVWKKPSSMAVQRMKDPLPLHPQSLESVYDDFLSYILPYNLNNIHPRFWAWVQGSGTPSGMLADMLASGLNANVTIGDHIPMYVEQQVLSWSKELFSFPQQASGLLTSGASIANITALVVARNHLHEDIKQKGLRSLSGQLRIYGSTETHNCLVKAAEIIGVGRDNFCLVPVDNRYRIRLDCLEQRIEEDKAAGYLPFCIIANAGTVNTGAIDDLKGLSDTARKENLWLHVDGAFGSAAKLLPEFQEVLQPLELADSLAFDFHKWFCVNYEVGCVLIRDGQAHRDAFTTPASYLSSHRRGLAAGPDPFTNYGMELSRGFKALKVWMGFKEFGVRKYASLVRQNISQAQYLAEQIRSSKFLELMAPVSLNIVCYRYNPGGVDEGQLNLLNKELLIQLQEQGIAAPSYTTLDGRYSIRVAITNHRSKFKDFDALVEASIRLGALIFGINN